MHTHEQRFMMKIIWISMDRSAWSHSRRTIVMSIGFVSQKRASYSGTSTLQIWRTVRQMASSFFCQSRDDDLAMIVLHCIGSSVFGLRGISSRLYYSWFPYQFEWSIRLLRRNEARGWRFIFECDCSDERSTTGSANVNWNKLSNEN